MLKPGFSFYFTECKKDGHGLINRAPAAAGYKAVFVRDDNAVYRYDLPCNVDLKEFKRWIVAVSARGLSAATVKGKFPNYEVRV